MDYLIQSTRRVYGKKIADHEIIDAKGKNVIVIGGGDTGSDCMGTAHRQGAKCVVQIEVMPKPPVSRTDAFPWPKYPMLLKTSSSQEEGGERQFAVLTKRFTGENGVIRKLECVNVEFQKDARGNSVMKEVPGSDFTVEADMVVLAMGFLHPVHDKLITDLKLDLDERGNVKADNISYKTSVKKVFTAGDMRRGQSLIVWAIAEGRRAAYSIDKELMGESFLPVM